MADREADKRRERIGHGPGRGEQVRDGAGAFDQLVRERSDEVRRLIRRRLGAKLRARLDSDDVLQEVLLEAAKLLVEREASTSMDGQEFLAWVARIIDNKIGNLARHHGAERRSIAREEPIDAAGGPTRLPSGQKTPSAELAECERAEALRRAIAALPPRMREVVELVHVKKLPVAEASRRMEKTPGSTSVLLSRALARLRENLLKTDV